MIKPVLIALQCDPNEREDDRTNQSETPDALRDVDMTVSPSADPPGSLFHTALLHQDSKS